VKAYEIVMIMFTFNLVVGLFQLMGLSPGDYNPYSPDSLFMMGIFGTIGLLGGAAILSYIPTMSKPNERGIIYGLFSGAFWALYGYNLQLFNSIGKGVPMFGAILAVFTALILIVYVMGVAQMATGGWRSYK